MLSHMLRASVGLPKSPLIFVGAATASSSSGAAFNVSLTALTGGVAAAPVQNDIVIVVTAVADNTACTATGYTQTALVSTTLSTVYVGRKFMGATPDTTVAVQGSGSNAQGACAVAYVWRGVNTTTPMDATPTTSSATNTAIPDPPAITPVTAGAVVLAMGGAGHQRGAVNFTSPTLANFRSTSANTAGDDATVGIGWASWYSGAYDPSPFTFGGTDSTAYMSCGVTLALRPA